MAYAHCGDPEPHAPHEWKWGTKTHACSGIDDEPLTVQRWALAALFDLCVGSMDFGSGFLDKEDVVALRAVAVVLGVDPMTGVPSDYKTEFKHTYVPDDPKPVRYPSVHVWGGPVVWDELPAREPICVHCSQSQDHPAHEEEEATT